MNTIDETLAAVIQLRREIDEKETQVVELIQKAVEAHVKNGERYLNEEDGKYYFPCFTFYKNEFCNNALRSNGIWYPKDTLLSNSLKIEVYCYPAKKDGSRASIGSRYIDITKLKPA